MLLDTLNTLIGFIGIVLLLSLLLTAMVQFVQNALKLRAGNLRIGLQALIEKLIDEKVLRVDDETKNPRRLRDAVLANARFVPQTNVRRFSKLMSPTTTWLKKEELIEHLSNAGAKLAEKEDEKLSLLFQRMEDYLRKRFTLNVRIITIVCAVVVAFYFQISTPALLKRLSSDPRYRAQAVSASEQFLDEAEALVVASTNYYDVSAMALEQLTAKHPERAAHLERISGLAETRDDLIAEMQTVLASLPASERAKLVEEYENLLKKLRERASAESLEKIRTLTDKLATYDIRPWPHGWKYLASAENIIGILITAAFLTFGAPFWYERLRDLIQLRDALKPKPKPKKTVTSEVTETE